MLLVTRGLGGGGQGRRLLTGCYVLGADLRHMRKDGYSRLSLSLCDSRECEDMGETRKCEE